MKKLYPLQLVSYNYKMFNKSKLKIKSVQWNQITTKQPNYDGHDFFIFLSLYIYVILFELTKI